MFCHQTRVRSHIYVFSCLFYRVTGRPPASSSLVLNFLQRGFVTSETAISILTISFLLHSPILCIFYRRLPHNPAFFYSYRSFFFPSRSSYPSHLFLFRLPRLTPSASVLRSCSRYSRSCLQLIWMHGVPPGIRKAFTGKQHVGHQKLRFISLIQSISLCLEMHESWGEVS